MSENRALTLDEITRYRKIKGQSILLFITHRCPVGCSHCSVNASPLSPGIKDYELFNRLVEGLSKLNELKLIGISGGEPFGERKGLESAVNILHGAGKQCVIYTSGFWGTKKIPRWINNILNKTSACFLGIDSFHEEKISSLALLDASIAILERQAGLILQYIDNEENLAITGELISNIHSRGYRQNIWLNPIPLLPFGRAESACNSQMEITADRFMGCDALNSMMLTYDGGLFVCCNEQRLSEQDGFFPQIKKTVSNILELHEAVDEFEHNSYFSIIKNFGFRFLLNHPGYASFKSKRYSNMCSLCRDILFERDKHNYQLKKDTL